MLIQLYGSYDQSRRSKVALVDRDGVINVNRPAGVLDSSDFEFVPRALDGLALLARNDWTVVVVTNQANVNRGVLSATSLFEIHNRMADSIRRAGGKIAAVLSCPHRPDEMCRCRKPAPGLLHEAARITDSAVTSTVFIGDHWTDLEAARAAQCRFVLVLSGRVDRAEVERYALGMDTVAVDLFDAARYLVFETNEAPVEVNANGLVRC